MSKVDKNAEWEKKRLEHDVKAIEDSINRPFASNPDAFLDIFEKLRNDPAAFKAAKAQSRKLPDNLDEDTGEVQSATISYDNSKYASIIERLDRFPFSNNEEIFQEQLKVVEGAFRTAMQTIIAKSVAGNTKNAFKDYCKQIIKIAGGLQATFNFGNGNIVVTAKGNFFGDETLCIYDNDNKYRAAVIKVVGENQFNDLSNEFDISIKRGN